jgi:hypothetical protein
MSDPDTAEEVDIAHGIMHMFQYQYRERWVEEQALFGNSRLWTKVFNDLVRKGFIERKRTFSGYRYKWKGRFPEY